MADERRITPADLRKLVLFAAVVYLAIMFISAIAKVIIVFSLVLLAVLVLNPIVTWLERYRIPRFVSAVVLALFVLGFLGLVAWVTIPRAVTEFSSLIAKAPEYLGKLKSWAGRELPSFAGSIPVSNEAIIKRGFEKLTPLLGGLAGYAASAADLIASAFIILISTIYSLSSPRPLATGFLALFPEKKRELVVETVQELSLQMRAWALATLIAMLMIFGLSWIALAILGVNGAFLLAVVAGVLEFVPILGPLMAGTFAGLVAVGQSTTLMLWVLLVFTAIQQIENHLIVPLVMSGRLQIHPVSVIFAVLVMGGIFGLVGVFLAAPAAAAVKVLVTKFYIEPRGAHEDESLPEDVEKMVTGEPLLQPPDAEDKQSG